MGASSGSEGRIVVYAAMAANATIAVAKLVAALVTGSSAMLAETVHSVADTGNEALLLLGLRRSQKRADAEHPFGHGQEVYFWGLIVAVVLFGLGGGISVYEGVHGLRTGEGIGDPTWAYVVLAVAFVSEGISWVIAMRKFRQRNRDRPMWQAFRQSKDPTLFIPLAEDTAALAGVIVAFVGVFFAHRLGEPAVDAIASLVIGAILASVAVFLASETKKLLVGEAIDGRLRRALERVAERDPSVLGVSSAAGMHLGPREILLHLRVRVRGDRSVNEMAAALARIEHHIRGRDPRVRHVFIDMEPVT